MGGFVRSFGEVTKKSCIQRDHLTLAYISSLSLLDGSSSITDDIPYPSR
jgi:hypothetical protein